MSEIKGLKSALRRVVALIPEPQKSTTSSEAINRQSTPKSSQLLKKSTATTEKSIFDIYKISSVNSLGHSGRAHCENGTRGYLEICLDPANFIYIKNVEIRQLTEKYSNLLKQQLPNILYNKHEGKDSDFDSLQKVMNKMSLVIQGLDSFVDNAAMLGLVITISESQLVTKLKDHYKKFIMRFKLEKAGFGPTMVNYMKTDYHYRELVGASDADAGIGEWQRMTKVPIYDLSALEAQAWKNKAVMKAAELTNLLAQIL